MSYCRFSNDDFQCDVYCYAHVSGGYTTHVASNRPVINGSLPPQVPLDSEHIDAWMDRNRKMMALLDGAERKLIGLPHDGESFNDETPAEAANRLQMLKDIGYNVPQYAIDALREEAEVA